MSRNAFAMMPMAAVVLAGLVGCAGHETQRAASSPDAVAATIHGANLETVKSTWYRMGASRPGLAPAAFKTTGRPATYPEGPFTAEVFRMELDGSNTGIDGGTDAIVRVSDAAGWDWQLLTFLDTPGGWQFAGAVDFPNNRVAAPAPRTRTLGPGMTWMMVDSHKQSSKAVNEREMVWYQVRNGRMTEVLRAPAEGHRIGVGAPFNVAYRAEVLDVFLTPNNRPAVTINLEAVYTNARPDGFGGLTELFRRTGVLRLVQAGDNGKFILDGGSDWSKDELAGLLTESADQFVHNNRVQLVDLAHSPDPNKRRWLARLQQDCDSPEVRQELAALVEVESSR